MSACDGWRFAFSLLIFSISDRMMYYESGMLCCCFTFFSSHRIDRDYAWLALDCMARFLLKKLFNHATSKVTYANRSIYFFNYLFSSMIALRPSHRMDLFFFCCSFCGCQMKVKKIMF